MPKLAIQLAALVLFLSALKGATGLAQSNAPSPVDKYYEEGQRALARGQFQEAEKIFEKLRELSPSVAEVHANLGLVYFNEKKFEAAVPALRQALKLKPSLTKTETLLAMSLSELAPASIWKQQASAEAWESQGSYDLAISEYRQVLSLDPRRPGLHYRLGRVLLARGAATNSQEDTAGALKEFSDELELDPTNANAAYELAETYRNSGEIEEAEKFFRLALQHYPDFDQANLGLAAVLLKQEKPA